MGRYKDFVGLGIAGNFALHLEQAGEMKEFKDVYTDDPNGPKGMFPFYLPRREGQLGVYPLSSDTIKLPKEPCNVQIEPEVALICDLAYDGDEVVSITPKAFAAYNDCSIRKEGAGKISEKKNWGEASKGLSNDHIPISAFAPGNGFEKWRIASFLRRSGDVYRYGEDVELTGYSYFYEKLTAWMIRQINTQNDFGPLEPLRAYLKDAGHPAQAIISIGATRYTSWGESHYLKAGDEVLVLLYDERYCCPNEVLKRVVKDDLQGEGLSLLRQKVVVA
jgi:hypothetical protein